MHLFEKVINDNMLSFVSYNTVLKRAINERIIKSVLEFFVSIVVIIRCNCIRQ